MKNRILFFFACLFLTTTAYAQKKDSTAFYMYNNGKMAESKELADFVRVLLPPDEGADKSLIMVNDVFKDGKRKLIAYTYINSPYIENGLQGSYIEYYHNGRRKYIRTYNNGKLTGECLSYYHNGKLYSIVNYKDEGAYLQQCSDSTGTVLAENGNGTWIKVNADFSYLAQGPVKDGLEDGVWKGSVADGQTEKAVYQNGKLISGIDFDKAASQIYTAVDFQPQFQGGDIEFLRYIARNVRYPRVALENKIEGRVILTFVIEKDGTPSDIKVLRGLGSGIDEEVVRVLRACPPWNPGIQKGKKVRVQYSVPIQFSL